jgi:enoyl-CoA hydratase/carnithine racemase
MIRECLLEIERMRASLRDEYDAAITLADGSAMDLSHSKKVTLDLMNLAGGASVGLITFNDPARMNAMTEGMAYVFRSVVDRVRGIRPDVLIVMGAGMAFSAGGDMGMIRRKQQRSVEINRAAMFAFYSAYLSLLDLEIPVIAAINGAAIGAGLCFACACDRRIAVDIDKKVLGFSFAKLGLTPGMGGTIFPRRLVGEGTAGEMLRRGYNITPKEAKEIGMVDDVVPAERFMSAAIEMADRIHSSPKAVERILAERVGRGERVELLGMEAMAQGASFLTERHLRMYGKFMAEFEERKARRRQPS